MMVLIFSVKIQILNMYFYIISYHYILLHLNIEIIPIGKYTDKLMYFSLKKKRFQLDLSDPS